MEGVLAEARNIRMALEGLESPATAFPAGLKVQNGVMVSIMHLFSTRLVLASCSNQLSVQVKAIFCFLSLMHPGEMERG